MTTTLTARYVKSPSGYMGQIIEWPEVVTEGTDLEECRDSLRDAVEQMALAYREQGQKIPIEHVLIETLPVETD